MAVAVQENRGPAFCVLRCCFPVRRGSGAFLITVATDQVLDLPLVCPNISKVPHVGSGEWEGSWL